MNRNWFTQQSLDTQKVVLVVVVKHRKRGINNFSMLNVKYLLVYTFLILGKQENRLSACANNFEGYRRSKQRYYRYLLHFQHEPGYTLFHIIRMTLLQTICVCVLYWCKSFWRL